MILRPDPDRIQRDDMVDRQGKRRNPAEGAQRIQQEPDGLAKFLHLQTNKPGANLIRNRAVSQECNRWHDLSENRWKMGDAGLCRAPSPTEHIALSCFTTFLRAKVDY